jgi:hypothetical protein
VPAHLFFSFWGMLYSPAVGIPLRSLPDCFPVIFDNLDRNNEIVGPTEKFISRSRIPSLSRLLFQSIGFIPHPFHLSVLPRHRFYLSDPEGLNCPKRPLEMP